MCVVRVAAARVRARRSKRGPLPAPPARAPPRSALGPRRSHPDPKGATLRLLGRVLEKFVADGGGTYAVFLDFCSLHQKDAAGQRTASEQTLFDRALKGAPCISELYSHPHTFILKASALPEGYPDGFAFPERFPDGTVGPHWVMVERITDTVTCADPYPWDDLDEEYEQDTIEFLVKWELAGSHSVRWQR